MYVLLSHLDLCKGNEEEMRRAKERIIQNEIKVIGTNTIPHNFTEDEKKHFDIVDIAPLIADIISVHSKGGSISRFFEDRLHHKPNLE